MAQLRILAFALTLTALCAALVAGSARTAAAHGYGYGYGAGYGYGHGYGSGYRGYSAYGPYRGPVYVLPHRGNSYGHYRPYRRHHGYQRPYGNDHYGYGYKYHRRGWHGY